MFDPTIATMTTELTAKDQRIAELERELAAAKAELAAANHLIFAAINTTCGEK